MCEQRAEPYEKRLVRAVTPARMLDVTRGLLSTVTSMPGRDGSERSVVYALYNRLSSVDVSHVQLRASAVWILLFG